MKHLEGLPYICIQPLCFLFLAAEISTTFERRRNNARLPKREQGRRSRFLCKVSPQTHINVLFRGNEDCICCVAADLVKEADTVRLMDDTIKQFGRLDILVNNAGIIQMGSIETTSLEQYDTVMNTNVR